MEIGVRGIGTKQISRHHVLEDNTRGSRACKAAQEKFQGGKTLIRCRKGVRGALESKLFYLASAQDP